MFSTTFNYLLNFHLFRSFVALTTLLIRSHIFKLALDLRLSNVAQCQLYLFKQHFALQHHFFQSLIRGLVLCLKSFQALNLQLLGTVFIG